MECDYTNYKPKYNNYRVKLFGNIVQLSLSNYGDAILYISIFILKTQYLLSVYSISHCKFFDLDLEIN